MSTDLRLLIKIRSCYSTASTYINQEQHPFSLRNQFLLYQINDMFVKDCGKAKTTKSARGKNII